MTRYIIDPAQFTASQWEELYAASTLVPRKYETRDKAKQFTRGKKEILLAVAACRKRADEVLHIQDDEAWAKDLLDAAAVLEAALGPQRISRREASRRLRDLLTQDIYTDAPEYRDRVAEVEWLLPRVFGDPPRLTDAERLERAEEEVQHLIRRNARLATWGKITRERLAELTAAYGTRNKLYAKIHGVTIEAAWTHYANLLIMAGDGV